MENLLEYLMECSVLEGVQADVQRIQTAHRLRLAEFWGIHKGSRVLEIGCGQGDTLAVLAGLAGDEGFVYGLDQAPPDYGMPETLGEAAERLLASPIGKQLHIQLNTDIHAVDFPENMFDYVVLSHCSWYFSSKKELEQVLLKLKKWAKKLCFAEWNPIITEIGQLPHLLAVQIQAQYECFKETSTSNVRTLFTPQDIMDAMIKSGWTLQDSCSITSPDLQDGQWETDYLLQVYDAELRRLPHLPEKAKELIRSQAAILRELVNAEPVLPLPVFACTAD